MNYFLLCSVLSPKFSAIICPEIQHVPNSRIEIEMDENDFPLAATIECAPGFVIWGQTHLQCNNGEWSSDIPSCNPLTCGPPPSVSHTSARLENGSALWKDVAVYSCDPGFLMVVNASSGCQASMTVPT